LVDRDAGLGYNAGLSSRWNTQGEPAMPGELRRSADEFKIGDKVVYPNHGIGVIEQIERRSLGERDEEFLKLRILANDSTVMVPRGNTNSVGLRRVMSKKEIDRIYEVLKDDNIQRYGDWKGRFQENSDKMRTGEIAEVARVFKSLSHLALQKNLSYRERRMLDKAKYLIVSELAEVERMPQDQVEAKVDRAVTRGIKQIKDR
jgi:CarD family transcriptional regulator